MLDFKKFEMELGEIGMSQEQFDKIKVELFKANQFKFKPSKSSVQKKIARILKIINIHDIPLIAITDELYFIGLYKLEAVIRGDFLQVKTGINKWERFSEFVQKNREMFIKCLTLLSI